MIEKIPNFKELKRSIESLLFSNKFFVIFSADSSDALSLFKLLIEIMLFDKEFELFSELILSN